MAFVHLHVHTNFSFGDGACRIDELVAAAQTMGMPALAVTDHDGLYGAVRFYQACKAAGIKPIVGVEISVESALGAAAPAAAAGGAGVEGGSAAPAQSSADERSETAQPSRAQRPPEAPAPPAAASRVSTATGCPSPPRGQWAAAGFHLVLLARDYRGWSNLCRIISAAHLERPGLPPLARWQTIAEHAGHLIALSACRRGEIATLLLQGRPTEARQAASHYAATFGRDGYYVELQNDLLPDSATLLQQLDLLARELRLPTVASNDVHYLEPEDAALHDVLAAEAANAPLPNPLGRRNTELSLKTAGQMWRLFRLYPDAFRASARIAARCNLDLGLGKLHFPAYPLPRGETAYSLLCKHCFKGAEDRYRPVTPQVLERLNKELRVIEELGFAEYFLAVRDIVESTRSRGILYSGRGSAGNSIVSYVLRITDADPLAHELLFERFLNPSRREMPDIDIDFCSRRRDEVIEYIYERFGADKVAMVATVQTVHAPSAVRIVARAFDFRPDEIDRLSKKVPWGSAAKLGEMLAERPELHDHEFQSPHYARLVGLAEKLGGYPMGLGTHLGGFILARDTLTDRVPLQWAAKGVIVAQFDKDDVETLGLVKMDILGLRMHSAIDEAVQKIRERTGAQISPWNLPKDDAAVYDLIAGARTVGVFQLESSGQRNLATRLRERTFDDIIAAISLFRPGPLQADMIGPFIRRRHGREKATVPHPDIWPALRRTYGVILYQEQVIEVASAIAGFTLAEADTLRRTMTHERSMEEMDELGRLFVCKAAARGVPRAAAEEVFRQLRGFAAYGFNKAHAACFAVICNTSAWLKAHYPAEFYCGLLNNQPMGFYSPRVVVNDARRWGLAILPVDANRSAAGFSVEDDGRAIRVGLEYVKEMSHAASAAIVHERGEERGGPYVSLPDFCRRTRVSVEIVANLVRVGAFDGLGVRREELVAQVPLVHAQVTGRAVGVGGGGGGAPPPPPPPTPPEALTLPLDDELPPLAFLPDWSLKQRLDAELEVLSLNVGAHPLTFARKSIDRLGVVPFARLHLVPDGRRIRLAGVLERAQMPWIRSGHRTLFLTLEDETGLAEVVVFNDIYLKYGRVLKEATYLLIEGELQNNDERGLAVVAHVVHDLAKVLRSSRGRLPRDDRSRTLNGPDTWELPAVAPRTRPGRTG
jgi:error-prone DNA polymerase